MVLRGVSLAILIALLPDGFSEEGLPRPHLHQRPCFHQLAVWSFDSDGVCFSTLRGLVIAIAVHPHQRYPPHRQKALRFSIVLGVSRHHHPLQHLHQQELEVFLLLLSAILCCKMGKNVVYADM